MAKSKPAFVWSLKIVKIFLLRVFLRSLERMLYPRFDRSEREKKLWRVTRISERADLEPSSWSSGVISLSQGSKTLQIVAGSISLKGRSKAPMEALWRDKASY